jgi:hypothetical protein
LGISAKYSDEGIFLFSVLAMGFHSWRLQTRLEELIEESKKDKAAAAKAAQTQNQIPKP